MAIPAGKIKQCVSKGSLGGGVCGTSTYLYCVNISLLSCE